MTHSGTTRRGFAIGMAAALGLGGLTAPAMAETDFAGERIEFIVPYDAGGGVDAYARFMAPFLQKHLPGQPTIIVRNLPGAGAIAGTNQFERTAGDDGLTILAVSTSTLLNSIMGDSRVEYTPSDWRPVVVSSLGMIVYANPSLGVKTPEDYAQAARDHREVIVGAHGPTSADLPQLLEMDMLGFEVRPVFGLARGPALQAFERGEVTVNYDNTGAYQTNVLPLVEIGSAVPVMAMGYVDGDGNVVRDPVISDLPDFPELYQMVHGEAPSGPAYEAWKALMTPRVVASKAIVLPKDTPDEIVDAYTKGVNDMLADPEFQAAAEKFLGSYPTLTGAPAQTIWKAGNTITPETREWLLTWLEKKFDYQR